jgi:cytochrome c553
MRTAKYFVMAVMGLGLVAGLGVFRAADDDKPKFTIEEIMEKAHKAPKKGQPSLLKKVVDGNASDEQKKQLVEYYEALAKNKPEKGSEDDWKKRTATMLTAAKKVAKGDDEARPQLGRAVNCKSCHQLHKPD